MDSDLYVQKCRSRAQPLKHICSSWIFVQERKLRLASTISWLRDNGFKSWVRPPAARSLPWCWRGGGWVRWSFSQHKQNLTHANYAYNSTADCLIRHPHLLAGGLPLQASLVYLHNQYKQEFCHSNSSRVISITSWRQAQMANDRALQLSVSWAAPWLPKLFPCLISQPGTSFKGDSEKHSGK